VSSDGPLPPSPWGAPGEPPRGPGDLTPIPPPPEPGPYDTSPYPPPAPEPAVPEPAAERPYAENPYAEQPYAQEAGLGGMLAEEAAPRTTGAHRVRHSPSRYILPAVVGALVVVAVGVGIVGWSNLSGSPDAAPSNTVHVSSTTHPASSATATSPSASASASPTTSPAASASATPTATKAPTPTRPPVVHAPAVLLNQTAIRGMAARVALRLRSLGWTITGVGNWRGRVPETTVYYPAGMEAAARSLAFDLGVTRIHGWVRGMLPDRLTVVLTSDPFA